MYSRMMGPGISSAEVALFGVLYAIALGFSAMAANNPLGMAVLVLTLLIGAGTVFVLLRARER